MGRPYRVLLERLSDGRFHSGPVIAAELGLSRGAVWKRIKQMQQDLGIAVHAVRGRGYRLSEPLDLLNEETIREVMGREESTRLRHLNLLCVTDSTNKRALADPPLSSNEPRVWMAEHQTSGRGRRGRKWISGFGENICLSVAWRFDLPMTELAALSLAVGVVVAEVLREFGVEDIVLKWPNDLIVRGAKLAGVLVEASGESGGPATAIIGVGLNTGVSARKGSAIDQRWVDLRQLGVAQGQRNRIAGRLITELLAACRLYGRVQFQPFHVRWSGLDSLSGCRVEVVQGAARTCGYCRGIDANGALLLDDQGVVKAFHAGEVSISKGGQR